MSLRKPPRYIDCQKLYKKANLFETINRIGLFRTIQLKLQRKRLWIKILKKADRRMRPRTIPTKGYLFRIIALDKELEIRGYGDVKDLADADRVAKKMLRSKLAIDMVCHVYDWRGICLAIIDKE